VAGGEITIRPDEVLVDGAGKTIMRRIRTGHGSSKDDDDVAAATFRSRPGMPRQAALWSWCISATRKSNQLKCRRRSLRIDRSRLLGLWRISAPVSSR